MSDASQSGPIIGNEGTRLPREFVQEVFNGEDPTKEFTVNFERGEDIKLGPPAYSADQLNNVSQEEREGPKS